MKYILLFLIYCFVNIGIAFIHKNIRAHKIRIGDPTQLNHSLWLGIYLALVALLWFVSHSWYLIGSVLLQHLFVFSTAFNLLIGMPPFNLSKTSTAKTDRLLVRLGFKSTEVPVLVTLLLSAALLTKSILNG